jgi:hypothetical protein
VLRSRVRSAVDETDRPVKTVKKWQRSFRSKEGRGEARVEKAELRLAGLGMSKKVAERQELRKRTKKRIGSRDIGAGNGHECYY